MAELTKITNIFGKPNSASKEPEVDDEGTTELSDSDINDMFDAVDEFDEEELNGDGRILIRASGTENLIRVMIEGKNTEEISRMANDIADLINKKFGI